MVLNSSPVVPKQPDASRVCGVRDLGEVGRAALELLLDAVRWAGSQRSGPSLADVTTRQLDDALRVGVLRAAVWELAERSGLLEPAVLCHGRLFTAKAPLLQAQDPVGVLALPGRVEATAHEQLIALLQPALAVPIGSEPLAVGSLFEALLTIETESTGEPGRFRLTASRHRKCTGSYFTPERVVQAVVESALRPWADSDARTVGQLSLCDPALGGGAFLLEAGRQLLGLLDRQQGPATAPDSSAWRTRLVTQALCGVDIDPLAVAVTEASLWLWAKDRELDPARLRSHLRVGDAVYGRDGSDAQLSILDPASEFHWLAEFPAVFARGGFDVVLGNPPWVAYAGRASQTLDPARRRYYAARYATMHGYPTLHSLFVERAVRLAPRGVVALLVPSPVADLGGYQAVRRAVTRSHRLREPLLEFGQDAFAGVTQPCFALVADPDHAARESDRPWTLVERARARAEASPVDPPEVLTRLARCDSLPGELFGEMGLQTTHQVTLKLLLRATAPDVRHRYPLLEGKNVQEFQEGPVRLYLCDDADALRAAGCRLRPESAYTRVRFVVRQTARVPIAALHNGQPFRNSLLAGFEHPDWPAELVVGLLNSALYRALHLALRRDARQAAFPQVKVAHLRALPRPSREPELMSGIKEVTKQATATGISQPLRRILDTLVFDLFGVAAEERSATLRFLQARVPQLGHAFGDPSLSDSHA